MGKRSYCACFAVAFEGGAAVKFQQAIVGLLNMADTGWEDKYVLHTED